MKSNDIRNNLVLSDMRIVASTASMLEEPYWRIEEPNPFLDKKSGARKTAERIINEATSLIQPQSGNNSQPASAKQNINGFKFLNPPIGFLKPVCRACDYSHV